MLETYAIIPSCELYVFAAVAQSVERRLGKAEVTSSILVSSFLCSSGLE